MTDPIEWHNDCDGMLYTRIPYVGKLPGKWQNGFSVRIDAHRSLGEDAANKMRDHIKAALDAFPAIPDPAGAMEKASRALRFFRCVIKSGEPWTDVCQSEYEEALAAIASLTPAGKGVTK